MGLPVEETIGGRGQTGEQVKGTGGRSYVVRPMSKTRLGGDSDGRQVKAGRRGTGRHAQQMGSGEVG